MGGDTSEIFDVYAGDLVQAMQEISSLLIDYPIVAIDTEFPGYFENTVQLSLLTQRQILSKHASAYAAYKINVDSLQLIQLGISLSNSAGETPKPHSTWQFNMLFDETTPLATTNSMNLLREHGIDFPRLSKDGIHPVALSYEIQTSGLIYNRNLTYVCFHGSSDFGYLTKAVTCNDLPYSKKDFDELLCILFPGKLYDLKHCGSWTGSLESLAGSYGVRWQGFQHQAGSDALVTLKTFHLLKDSVDFLNPANDHVIYGFH